MYRGVDVSGYHGVIDWNRAKADGVEFAVLKVIRKDLKPDKQFENNWYGCMEAGVAVSGVYQYAYASTVERAVMDARCVLEILGKNRKPFVWLHWEAKCLPKGKDAAKIINAYGDIITAGGCKFGVCFGKTFRGADKEKIVPYIRTEYQKSWEMWYPFDGRMKLTDPISQSGDHEGTKKQFHGWKYSENGMVDGIPKKVGLNLWYKDNESEQLIFPEITPAFHFLGIIWEKQGIWNVIDVGEQALVPC